MTKSEEIAAFTAFLESLPGDSYLRPWLEQQQPQVISAIHSDVMPDVFALSASEFHAMRSMHLEQSKREAAELMRAAELKASKILADAESRANRQIENLLNAISCAEREIHAA